MENNTEFIKGDLLMVLEALKIVNKEFHISEDNNAEKNNILLYDSLIFNIDREDSLYFQVKVTYN
jgi:hypothetical protein